MDKRHELLQLLACPRCRGGLEARGEPLQGLSCAACGLLFPVRDGIPVMLLEEAQPLEKTQNNETPSKTPPDAD